MHNEAASLALQEVTLNEAEDSHHSLEKMVE
jgi:hypothetical protein